MAAQITLFFQALRPSDPAVHLSSRPGLHSEVSFPSEQGWEVPGRPPQPFKLGGISLQLPLNRSQSCITHS